MQEADDKLNKAADAKVTDTQRKRKYSKDLRAVQQFKPRRKRKYSKGLPRGVQKFERNASRALHRVTRSLETGVCVWRKQTDRSARRRRDGAIRDALDNFAKATGKGLRVISRAPEDMVRAFRSLRIRRIARRLFPVL
jgi:hypothetical protein